MTISPAIVQNQPDGLAKDRTKKPYFALNGPELVNLSVNSICDRIKSALIDTLMKNTRLASEIHAFPEAQVTINYEVLLSPHGEGRKIRVTDSIFVKNTDAIPPDATRILNNMPVLVEEAPKNANLLGNVGKVDVPKTAAQIDPQLKPMTDAQFGNSDPFKTDKGQLIVEIIGEEPAPIEKASKK